MADPQKSLLEYFMSEGVAALLEQEPTADEWAERLRLVNEISAEYSQAVESERPMMADAMRRALEGDCDPLHGIADRLAAELHAMLTRVLGSCGETVEEMRRAQRASYDRAVEEIRRGIQPE